jgi:hypothetical protein
VLVFRAAKWPCRHHHQCSCELQPAPASHPDPSGGEALRVGENLQSPDPRSRPSVPSPGVPAREMAALRRPPVRASPAAEMRAHCAAEIVHDGPVYSQEAVREGRDPVREPVREQVRDSAAPARYGNVEWWQ